MPKFKLIVDYPVTVGNPRNLEAMTVAPGSTIEVPGEVVTSDGSGLPGDAYIVADRGVEKAWPHALWSLEDKPAAKQAPAVKEN